MKSVPWVLAGRAVVLATIGWVAWPHDARAECVYAQVDITVQDGAPIHVLGHPDPCVTETPWKQGAFYTDGFRQTGLPTGSPNGYEADFRVPAP
jgi:hypothetical protein